MDITKQFDKASEAVKRNNFGYAVNLFQDILAIQPEFLQARKALRAVGERIFKEKGGGFFLKITAFFIGLVPLIKIMIFSLSKKHEKIIIDCENYLQNDPYNKFMLSRLAKSAFELEYNDTAIFTCEYLLEKNPRSVSTLRMLAALYQRKKDYGKAIEFYNRILKIIPSDQEAHRGSKDLAAMNTISKSNLETAKSSRDVMVDQKETEELDQEERMIHTAEDLEKAFDRVNKRIEQSPDASKNYVRLGELYERKNDFENAKKSYEKAKSLNPEDFSITLKIGDLAINSKTAAIKELVKQSKAAPENPEIRKKLDLLKKEQIEIAITEYQRRVKAQPTNLAFHFNLGKFSFAQGNLDQSISELQQSSKDPKHRTDSFNMLGLCFTSKKQYDLARHQFEQALESLPDMTEKKKEVLYNLGCLHEKNSQQQEAKNIFEQIYEIDINFKDVAAKIEN